MHVKCIQGHIMLFKRESVHFHHDKKASRISDINYCMGHLYAVYSYIVHRKYIVQNVLIFCVQMGTYTSIAYELKYSDAGSLYSINDVW